MSGPTREQVLRMAREAGFPVLGPERTKAAERFAALVAAAERDAIARELLTPDVFQRLVDWLREAPIRPAATAFTAGIERQIAYALEMDVLPEVKRLRMRLQALGEKP